MTDSPPFPPPSHLSVRPADVPGPPPREGLPAHYRMRADAHYVEALSRPAVRADSAPPATSTETPFGRALPLAVPALAESLETVLSALAQVRLPGRPLAERVGIELARAEAQRAHWLAQALAVLRQEPVPALDRVDLADVLTHVAEAIGPEQRLTGVAPSVLVPDEPVPVTGDGRLLRVALGSVVLAMVGLAGGRADASRVLARVATRSERDCRVVEVVQSAVRVPAAALARFFDATETAHPAGVVGATLLAAAHRVARAHGGWLDAAPLGHGGCRLSLGIPVWP